MGAFGRFIKPLLLLGAGVVGVLLLGMLALAGAGLLFQHLYLAIIVLLVVVVFAGLGRWKAFNFRVERPWLRPGTSSADRRFQERWEREHLKERFQGAQREEHWRE